MTDRELLEDAAKAAGMTLKWGEKYKLGDDIIDCTDIPYAKSNQPDEADMHWNPLTDDGDAFRLMVKLELLVDTNGMHVQVGFPYEAPLAYEKMGVLDDPYAATRRAIVRAAAEIGKEMK
jgi:hypothetical protein